MKAVYKLRVISFLSQNEQWRYAHGALHLCLESEKLYSIPVFTSLRYYFFIRNELTRKLRFYSLRLIDDGYYIWEWCINLAKSKQFVWYRNRMGKKNKKALQYGVSVSPQSGPLLGSSSPIPCNSVMMHNYYVDA